MIRKGNKDKKKELFRYTGMIHKEIIDILRKEAVKDSRNLSSMINKALGEYCKDKVNKEEI